MTFSTVLYYMLRRERYANENWEQKLITHLCKSEDLP